MKSIYSNRTSRQFVLASAFLLTALPTISFGQSIQSFVLSPSTVIAGASAKGTIILTAAAGRNGLKIALSGDASVVSVPVSITIGAGATTGQFDIQTLTPNRGGPATISATVSRIKTTAILTIKPSSGLMDSPWPKYRGGLANLGRVGGKGTTFTILEGPSGVGNFFSSPVIDVDGWAYIGNDNGNVYAYDEKMQQKWAFQTGDWVRSTPALAKDGTLYVGSNDHFVYALNSKTGKLLKSFQTIGAVPSSPTIGFDGTVYFGSNDGKLYAFNPDLTLKWGKPFQANGPITSPAIGDDGNVYFGSMDGGLYSVTPEGVLRKGYPFLSGGSIIDCAPAVSGGLVWFCRSNSGVFALNCSDGTLHKYIPTSSYLTTSVAISSTGIVYYCGRGGGLRWADANGEISSISLSSSEIRVPPSIDGNGFVYVSCTDGRMYRFDPAKAKFTSFNLKSGALWSAPTIDRNGWIYVGTSGGAFVRIK